MINKGFKFHHLSIVLISIILITTSICSAPKQVSAADGEWIITGSLKNPHYQLHTTTLLSNGKVLIAGGCTSNRCIDSIVTANVEIYDPDNKSWTSTTPMNSPRGHHSAVLLPNGKVLIAGGSSGLNMYLNSVELFDPETETWTTQNPMSLERVAFNLLVLPNGKVLAAGGHNLSGSLTGSELFDPITGNWTTTGSLNTARDGKTILINNEKVLFAGGENMTPPATTFLTSAELYDIENGTWTYTSSMNESHSFNPPIQLIDGKVLYTGNPCGVTCELFDPTSETWSYTGSMSVARRAAAIIRLPDGRVLAAGGNICGGAANVTSAEIYDPKTGAWSNINPMNFGKEWIPATLLPNGNVLISIGTDSEYYTDDYGPIANAGPNQSVLTMQTVTLDGNASNDPDGNLPITYQWTQTAGQTVTLNDPQSEIPTFTAPNDPDNLIFTLVVTDNIGNSSAPDEVIIMVNNQAPIANAGENQSVDTLSVVTLDGSGSDPDGDLPLTYYWTQTSGTAVTLSNPNIANPTFTTPDSPVELTFSLVVKDSFNLASQADEVSVKTYNQSPVANAGLDQSVNTITSVTLNGSGSSDPDNDYPLAYYWTQVSGPSVTLYGQNTSAPTFVSPNDPCTLTFSLYVTDNFGALSSEDTVNVIVINRAPIAGAGEDQSVNTMTTVQLNGSGSDTDGDLPLTYQWTQTEGTIITLSNATILNPTFTAPNDPTTIKFELVVTDYLGLAPNPDEVIITVNNRAPVANAGENQSVDTKAQVTLDASLSNDPDGDIPLTYLWWQISGPYVVLDNYNAMNPKFSAPSNPATITFGLEVTDSLGRTSLSDEVTITVNNQAPIANAGLDQVIGTLSTVTMDGSNCYDPDGDYPLTFLWTQTSGTTVSLSNPNAMNPTFETSATPDIYTFTLVVTDYLGLASAPDEVIITTNGYQIFLPLIIK